MLCINNNLKLCKFEGCLGSYFYLQNEKDFSLAACKGSTLKKKKKQQNYVSHQDLKLSITR